MKLLKTTIILLFSFQFLTAQTVLSLEEAIKITLENNYSIQIVKKSAEISSNNISPGNAGMFPKVDLNGNNSSSNNDSKLKLATGLEIDKPGNISNSLAGRIELDWTLFDGFGMFISYDITRN